MNLKYHFIPMAYPPMDTNLKTGVTIVQIKLQCHDTALFLSETHYQKVSTTFSGLTCCQMTNCTPAYRTLQCQTKTQGNLRQHKMIYATCPTRSSASCAYFKDESKLSIYQNHRQTASKTAENN